MRDEELTALLRSPALALEPAPDLVAGVQRGARRVRRRRMAAAAGAAAVLAVCAAALAPSLSGEAPPRDRVAAELAARFPQATSSVELLERVNDGDVVTFYSGTRWCTGSARTHVNDGCRGYVGRGPVAPFALLLHPGDTTLRIDADTVTAGVLGTEVEQVTVKLDDGTVLPASAVSGRGFPRPVWWALVPVGRAVVAYTAYGTAGEVVEELTVQYDGSYEPSTGS